MGIYTNGNIFGIKIYTFYTECSTTYDKGTFIMWH